MVVYPNIARIRDLNSIWSLAFPGTLRLFQNDIVPDVDTVEGDLDECDFESYNAVNVTWGATAINPDGNAAKIGLLCLFTHGVGGVANDVYGWYLIDNLNGELKYVERFEDAPRVMDSLGDSIAITPSVTQGGCPS